MSKHLSAPPKRQENPFKILTDSIEKQCFLAMQDTGKAICDEMKATLTAKGHIDTGALRDSIHYEAEQHSDNTVTLKIYADAQNPENGAYYAEFIELGTGAAHGREGGRVGKWRYKDSHGEWHTTDGMDADPFIEPSVENNLPRIAEFFKTRFYDIAKYGTGVADND